MSDEPKETATGAMKPGHSNAEWRRMTVEDFEKFPEVRVFSACGPCLTGYRLVRQNAQSATVAFWNGSHPDIERVFAVHAEPCVSCRDHPNTQYRNGYMD